MDTDDLLARVRDRRRLPSPAARKQLREQSGLSQRDLGAALGVTREAVARWENGQRQPRPANLRKYVGLLDRLVQESLSA